MTRPLAAVLLASAVVGAGLPASADTSGKKIALSNNYAGNSWRQAMLQSWDKVTKQAVADGVVAAADAFTTAENQVTEQAAQIQNLILQGYDAIVSTPPRPTRSTARSRKPATPASPSSPSTASSPSPAPGASRSTSSRWARTRSLYLAEKMPEGGNLLEIRGLAGVFVDDAISAGHPRGRRREPAVQDRRLGARRLGRRTWRRRRSPASCRACPRSSAS